MSAKSIFTPMLIYILSINHATAQFVAITRDDSTTMKCIGQSYTFHATTTTCAGRLLTGRYSSETTKSRHDLLVKLDGVCNYNGTITNKPTVDALIKRMQPLEDRERLEYIKCTDNGEKSSIEETKKEIEILSEVEKYFCDSKIGSIPGYPDGGSDAWRSSNDQIFQDAVDDFNKSHNLTPSSPDYWTAQRLKAQAMMESGGDKQAFLSDPLQVNNADDWVPEKADIAGIKDGQVMTPKTSAAAALKWLYYKGHIHDANGKVVGYLGEKAALARYNGSPNSQNYARKIMEMEKGVIKCN